MIRKSFCVLACSMLMFSCSSDNSQEETAVDYNPDFVGYYKITSIKSDKAVDMNNDGVQSKDIYSEISLPYVLNKTDKPVSYYKFDQYICYAEVGLANNKKLNEIILHLPYQEIDYIGKSDNTFPILSFYNQDTSFYSFVFIDAKGLKIQPIFSDTSSKVKATKIRLINDNSFTVNADATLFDFKTEQWITAQIEVVYDKVKG